MSRRRQIAAAFTWGGMAVIADPAFAQPQPLQRVDVTGTHIRRADTETASPVTVITREDLERTGKQSIQDVLRGITIDGQNSLPSSFSDGFATGAAAVSLRGLGVHSTLVLVNGRRMTTYGLADDGTRNFVDLNSLPLEAVDRIEVLKDGASAIYGADAVGGVVNVILRKSYTGASIGGSYGMTGKKDGRTTRAFGTVGFGHLDTDKHNVFLSLEASTQKNIWATDRGFLGWSDLRPLGFYDTTVGELRPWLGANVTINSPYGVTRAAPFPGSGPRVNVIPCPGNTSATTGLCLYNPLVEQELQPATDRLNVFGRATFQLSSSLLAYTELGFFKARTRANGVLSWNNDGGVFNPRDLFNPLILHNPMILPAAHPDNPFGADRVLGYRPFELGGRDQTTDNQVTRLLQGLQGTAFAWDYDVGLSYIRSRLERIKTGYIHYDALQAALDNGTYRINLPNTTAPSVLAAVSPRLVQVPTSSIKSIDAKLNRDLVDLRGGPLSLAFGGEIRWEAADTPPVPFTDTGAIIGLGYSAFSAKRRVHALFGEVNAPVTPWLELNAAVRFDHYSDFGDSTTPKLGFKVKPTDRLAIRGTYAEAFRAPGPAERGGSSFGFTSFGTLSQGNPDIQPETAKSYTLGLIAEPTNGSSVTLDYWRIDRKNEIVQADGASIIPAGQCQLGCAGLAGTRQPGVQPNTFLYYDSDGNLVTVTGFYRNAARTKTDGVDLELRHRMSLGEAGKLTGQLNWTHTRKFQRTDPFGTTFEYAGTHGPIGLSTGAGTPKDRATLSMTWDRGPWTVTGAVNYVGSLRLVDHQGEMARDEGGGDVLDETNGLLYTSNGRLDCAVFLTNGEPPSNCKLPSFTTFDLFAKWSPTKNLDLNFSIQNLFDRKAPFDPYLVLTYGYSHNQAWHQAGAVGRFFSVGAKYSF